MLAKAKRVHKPRLRVGAVGARARTLLGWTATCRRRGISLVSYLRRGLNVGTLTNEMQRDKKQRRRRTTGVAAAAVMAVTATTPLWAGCSGCSNRLPPNPVPGPDGPPGLPEWYPEKPWNAAEGDSQIYIEGKIVFATDKAIIRPGSEKVLNELLKFAKERQDVTRIRIEGHTDSRASEEYNQDLSARRALAVCDWLVDHGIGHHRLLAVGFGESRPIGPNDTGVGRQENRRTEFHVAEVEGVPFGGTDPTNGGLALDVLSKEERETLAKKGKVEFKPPPPFEPTGDEIKAVKAEQTNTVEDME